MQEKKYEFPVIFVKNHTESARSSKPISRIHPFVARPLLFV